MKVSILIPCYNARPWIAQAIQSALDQTWPHKEVIVLDDGSTDGSLDVIRSFAPGIQFESTPNRGGNAARNRLLQLASGDWLQYLDADDYLLPDKIVSQLSSVDPSSADVIFSPVTLEHCHDALPPRRELLPIPQPHDPWILLARWFLPQTGAALWRRSALASVAGWTPDLPCCQEHDLYLRLLAAGMRFVYSPAPGAVYRQWSLDTVCRRDPLRTAMTRLDVVRRLESHLLAHDALSPERMDAVAHIRLESARALFQLDRKASRHAFNETIANHPRFQPPPAPCFPPMYRLAYRIVGFLNAERIANLLRTKRPANRPRI